MTATPSDVGRGKRLREKPGRTRSPRRKQPNRAPAISWRRSVGGVLTQIRGEGDYRHRRDRQNDCPPEARHRLNEDGPTSGGMSSGNSVLLWLGSDQGVNSWQADPDRAQAAGTCTVITMVACCMGGQHGPEIHGW
jgi:hypothetical protein